MNCVFVHCDLWPIEDRRLIHVIPCVQVLHGTLESGERFRMLVFRLKSQFYAHEGSQKVKYKNLDICLKILNEWQLLSNSRILDLVSSSKIRSC